MIAISTVFLFLNLRRLEQKTSMLLEDISALRGIILQQAVCRRPMVQQPVNSQEIISGGRDEDVATEDLQKEIAEYERQIRELNELKGDEVDDPHKEIMSGLANIMAGIPQMGNWGGMGITVIHSADIPMPVPTQVEEPGKITEIEESTPVVEEADDVSQTPSETHSISGISGEARLIAEKYTLPQLKDLCKKHGLPMKGNKNELCSRLAGVKEVVESSQRNTLVMKLA